MLGGLTGGNLQDRGWRHGGIPTEDLDGCLDTLRDFALHCYRRQVVRDCLKYLWQTHGDDWPVQRTKGRKETASRARDETSLDLDLEAIRDIIWRVLKNSWFEYPFGSSLFFFRFPEKYRKLARDGVPVFVEGDLPTETKPQPTSPPEALSVLQDKLSKMVERRYIKDPMRAPQAWIFYFAVPKGVVDEVVLDWRIVYDAGANGLNDAVWAPSFWMPTFMSLLRILDTSSWMEDRDLGEMFINFPLHRSVRRCTGVDLRPLGLSEYLLGGVGRTRKEWRRCLMGFKSSPYNAIRTNLIAEEIIRGDRQDSDNTFQWEEVAMNLPGTGDYDPTRGWIARLRKDGTLATDYVCFVDDQRFAGGSNERLVACGHRVSTRKSCLGIQDALRKLRASGGTKHPGSWAGVVVINDDELGLVILTSQEKWDRMKQIIRKWLARLEAGEKRVDHGELASDRGFLVYLTQAYPALTPYLKGIHLTLETWRGGRDHEGWKLPRHSPATTKGEDELDPSSAFSWDGDALTCDIPSSSSFDVDDDATIMTETKTRTPLGHKPKSGRTKVVPRLKSDLKALRLLTAADTRSLRVVRSRKTITALYGFSDASSGGFGSSIQRWGGISARYGLWGRDTENASSNYRELRNLVEAVEEEAKGGELEDTELWFFTDNSTAENCFARGSSKSKRLHQLVLRLRKLEMERGFTLYVVHVTGTLG